MTAIRVAAATFLRSRIHVAASVFASCELLVALPLSGGATGSAATIGSPVFGAPDGAASPARSSAYHYRHAGVTGEAICWFARLTFEPDLGGQYIHDPRDVHRWRSGALLPDGELLEHPVMH